MVHSTQAHEQIEKEIKATLKSESVGIEGVFSVMVRKSKGLRVLIGNHPNGPVSQRTLPQFDIGTVKWQGMDSFMRDAETSFRAHIAVPDVPKPIFTLLGTHDHIGVTTKKLLVYIGVILAPHSLISFNSRASFEKEQWVDPRSASFRKFIEAGVRDKSKANMHLKMVDALVPVALKVKIEKNIAA